MKSIMSNKKGQIGTLQSIIITLVIIGIVLGVGFLVLEEFSDELDAGTQSQTGVNETISALAEIPSWLSIIVIIAIVGIILAIVFTVLPRGQAV